MLQSVAGIQGSMLPGAQDQEAGLLRNSSPRGARGPQQPGRGKIQVGGIPLADTHKPAFTSCWSWQHPCLHDICAAHA